MTRTRADFDRAGEFCVADRRDLGGRELDAHRPAVAVRRGWRSLVVSGPATGLTRPADSQTIVTSSMTIRRDFGAMPRSRRVQPVRRRLDRPAPREREARVLLISQSAEQQQITRGQLTLHADRGPAMTSKPVAFLLTDIGVLGSHNRPYTSADNPYSEAHLKTLKYRPEFPERFANIEHARSFCRTFFDWYNHSHRHSGIGLMTPAAVHHDQARVLHAKRQRVLQAAYAQTPERFVCHPQRQPALPTAVWINKPNTEATAH